MTARLFYEDEFDALHSMIGASGKTLKECAAFLWPDMKPASAYAKLQACLDRAGDERLKFGQVIALMNFCAAFDPLLYACDETMHARPDRKAPADDEVRLTQAIESAAGELRKAMQALAVAQSRHANLRSAA